MSELLRTPNKFQYYEVQIPGDGEFDFFSVLSNQYDDAHDSYDQLDFQSAIGHADKLNEHDAGAYVVIVTVERVYPAQN